MNGFFRSPGSAFWRPRHLPPRNSSIATMIAGLPCTACGPRRLLACISNALQTRPGTVAGCEDLGRITDAPYHSRRAQANARGHPAERRYRNAQFRGGADAVRQALSGGGRGAHRPSDRRKRPESCRCRCSSPRRRLRRVLRLRKSHLLDRYSETCLRRVWLVQRFSLWMTSMLHRIPGTTVSRSTGS